MSRSRENSGYVAAIILVAGTTGAALLLARAIGIGSVALIYLVPVLAAATLRGLRAGLVASLASALAYNFFFTEPRHTLRINDPANVVTVAIFLLVAVVTSQLAARLRAAAGEAAARADRNATLIGLARQLLGCGTDAAIADTLCRETGKLFSLNTVFLSPDDGLKVLAGHPFSWEVDAINATAARVALETRESTGRGTARFGAADWTFYPLRAGGRVVGVLGLARDDGSTTVDETAMPLLDSILDQAALALDRVRLEQDMIGVAALRERDRLRGALLSSVSHDLRTPLTAVLGAAAELRRRGPADPVLESLEAEALRLDRLIGNLLDMVRVEAGAIRLNIEPLDLEDAVRTAARDVAPSLVDRVLRLDMPGDLPLVQADPQLLHHCLINLLDNAGRHSPPGSLVLVEVTEDDGGLSLSIVDEGKGIPKGQELAVFEVFRRLEGSDRSGGTGLGLAIVRGFAEAMGIEAIARSAGKGEFVLRFPPDSLLHPIVETP
jgi:two-component system sensor histidine kinase KdpD